MTQQELADRLRACREYCGYSQQEVADHLGLHRPAVSEIEAGRRKVDVLELAKMARLFHKPVSYFIMETPEYLATAGEHSEALADATQALLSGLDEQDRKELLAFVEFLSWRKKMEG